MAVRLEPPMTRAGIEKMSVEERTLTCSSCRNYFLNKTGDRSLDSDRGARRIVVAREQPNLEGDRPYTKVTAKCLLCMITSGGGQKLRNMNQFERYFCRRDAVSTNSKWRFLIFFHCSVVGFSTAASSLITGPPAQARRPRDDGRRVPVEEPASQEGRQVRVVPSRRATDASRP
mmetsp:Transcript_30825/g.99409  ORF Transcript_30825/g.99409 Transcript_30825/m.99409 type:complete len:174 (-) Transcript_30825:1009-1530(-)